MATAKRSGTTPSDPTSAGIFSEAQRRTLTALAEGFVAGGGAARAAAAETAIAKVVDPALHGQLRLVLNLLDTRLGSLLIGGRLARFGTLKATQRDEFLRRCGALVRDVAPSGARTRLAVLPLACRSARGVRQ